MPHVEDPHRTWPPELVDQIVQEARDLAAAEDVLALLAALSLASRDFYISARRLRWSFIKIKYYPFHGEDSEWSRARNDRLYEILKTSRGVREAVKYVMLDVEVAIGHVDGWNVEGHPEGTQNTQDPLTSTSNPPALPTFDPHSGPATPSNLSPNVESDMALTMSLCLLSTANVETFTMSVSCPRGINEHGFHNVRLASLPDEFLFSLTAIRTSPSLTEISIHFATQPPHALVFGDPSVDRVEEARLEIELPEEEVRDYTVSRDSPSLVDLTDDAYLRAAKAIAYFKRKDPGNAMKPSYPLFPQLNSLSHISYTAGRSLAVHLLEQTPIGSSTPLGGHLPSLKALSLETHSGLTIVGHVSAEAFLCSVAPRLEKLTLCAGGRRCLPPDLSIFKTLTSLEFDNVVCQLDPPLVLASAYTSEEPLKTLLPALHSLSQSTTLRSLSLGMIIPSSTIANYVLTLQQHAFWSQIDDVFVAIARVISPHRLGVDVKLRVLLSNNNASPPNPQALAEGESQGVESEVGQWEAEFESASKLFAMDIFPKAKVYSGIDLCIEPYPHMS